jgi:hypothetical protein
VTSNHADFQRMVDGECLLMRPVNQDASKHDVLRFVKYDYTPSKTNEVVVLIQNNLNPSLISEDINKKYPNGHPRWKRELFGYCVPTSFALLFFMDTDNLHPFTGSDPDGENHWWLQDMKSGERFDPTSSQYSPKELEFVYSTGKPKRLYSYQGRPQKRFLDLMQMVQPNAKRYITSSVEENLNSLESFMK